RSRARAEGVRRPAQEGAGGLMHTIRDVMTTTLLTVEATQTLTEAAAQMHDRGVGAALALHSQRLAGSLPHRRALPARPPGPAPEAVEPPERPRHAAAIMLHGGFRDLPVLEGDTPIGIVSIRDLMRVVIDD